MPEHKPRTWGSVENVYGVKQMPTKANYTVAGVGVGTGARGEEVIST